MNPMICTIRSGIRSRSRPRRMSSGSVVAAKVRDEATPIVPLASRPKAATSPGSESESPSTSVLGPVAMKGTRMAKNTNGTSITIRLAM